jgi:two-component system sensor histidine kinase HydH
MRMESVEVEEVRERLEQLLGRSVPAGEPIHLSAVAGLDATELESAFRSTRNYTILLAVILLLVGGAAIYFLFVTATYRSTRTALENMRSYTSNIIESMKNGLVSLDADGRVATVNAGARAILGLGSEPVEGRPGAEVLRVASDRDGSVIGSVLSGGREFVELEARLEGRDGAIPVSISASALRDEDGERAGTVLLFQDLREIEELKEAVEREKHLAALGRLAAGVAHEVRNPLSSLKGFAQFFRTKFAPGSEEERYSDIMIEEVERLDRVVQELLEFARPLEPDRRPTAPNAIIEEALALVSEDAQFRHVAVERRLAGELPDVMVDPMQMRQAVLNVFLNAIEAMGDGGTLIVESGETTAPDGARSVTLGITDTGPGMSAPELDKLFEPFYTTKPKGTGLGMTVVSRVVEQNGGRVQVASVQGEGTTFTFVLPVADGS